MQWRRGLAAPPLSAARPPTWKWSSHPECDAPGDNSRWTPFHRNAKGDVKNTSEGSTHAK